MFQELVSKEIMRARAKHPKINSFHEGYAVLLEEVDEFKELVWKLAWKDGDKANMLSELTQIAAMAQRIAEDRNLIEASECCLESDKNLHLDCACNI